jgi:hypothetical protein
VQCCCLKLQFKKKERVGNSKYTHLLKSFDYSLTSHEEIEMIELVRNRNSTRLYTESLEELKFTESVIYMSKGERYFVLLDNQGFITTLFTNGKFRSRYYSGFKEIKNLTKHSLSLIFSSGGTIGFIKF